MAPSPDRAAKRSETPLLTVARWMGHKNTKMVEETYGHLLEQYMQDEMKKVRILPETTPGEKA